jgi:hypothetical protein
MPASGRARQDPTGLYPFEREEMDLDSSCRRRGLTRRKAEDVIQPAPDRRRR